jgi:hypothetical protein
MPRNVEKAAFIAQLISRASLIPARKACRRSIRGGGFIIDCSVFPTVLKYCRDSGQELVMPCFLLTAQVGNWWRKGTTLRC